jgi:hypothetical protein
MRVALRTVAVALLPPFHHIAATAVFRNQLAQLIAALARAFAAFDAQHIELAFDVAENEIGSVARAYSITSSARPSNEGGRSSPSAFADLRFITSSNLTGNYTGSSPGFSPLRMRST